MNIKAGFSKADLMEILPEEKSCEIPLSAHGFYLSRSDDHSFFLVTDFMDFDFQAISHLKNAVAPGLPENTKIHIMTVHNHGGGTWDQLNIERFSELALMCAKQAVANCREAEIRAVQGSLDQKISIKRRIFVPEINGSFTCFYGVDSTAPGNASSFVNTALKNLEQGLLTFTGSGTSDGDERSFPDGDQQFSILEFRTPDGIPLGNIVRFAAHAVCCNLPDCYSSDFPGYLREILEKQLGGISVFMNGPCADIAPAIRKKSPEEGKRIANILAGNILNRLKNEPFLPLTTFTDSLWEIPLTVRKELISPEEDSCSELAENTGLCAVKKSLELEYLRGNLPFLQKIYRNGVPVPNGKITVSTALLCLNEWNLLFFSGETFSGTAKKITECFPQKKWITFTEHDRTAMYIPPKQEYFRGGYEPACAVVAPDGEEELRMQMIALLQTEFKNNENAEKGRNKNENLD